MRGSFARPRLVFSACLNCEPVRYNARIIEDEFCKKLAEHADVIRVCPEVGIGLSVPRSPIVIVFDGEKRFVQKDTGQDLTKRLVEFSADFLEKLGAVDGFVLKRKSPSCALSDATAYKFSRNTRFVLKTSGVFAQMAMEKFSKVAFIDEFSLRNFWLREHFLCRIFASAEMRGMFKGDFTKTDILKFHERYKYLLMAHSPSLLKKLGRLVSNLNALALTDLVREYSDLFTMALTIKPTKAKHFNVLQHIYGYFKDRVSDVEKRKLLSLLDDFATDSTSLTKIRAIFREYARELHIDYLLDQRYLSPYPLELETDV
ncbi:YbgA family protein [Pseudothermotoga sp.]